MTTPQLVANPAAELTADLDDWGPRPEPTAATPLMSGRIFYEGDGVQVGVWECTPGGWPIENRPDHETVQILAGRARLTNADGSSVELVGRRRADAPQGLVRPLGHPRDGAQALRHRRVESAPCCSVHAPPVVYWIQSLRASGVHHAGPPTRPDRRRHPARRRGAGDPRHGRAQFGDDRLRPHIAEWFEAAPPGPRAGPRAR